MRLGFQSESLAVRSSDGRSFTLIEPLVYLSNREGTLVVPAGTTTDGASTPRALWRVIPPFGDYWMAAVLHDFLYRETTYPKDHCDRIFLEAMQSLGVPEALADAIYQGVNHFGQTSFNEDRRLLPSLS